MKAIITKIEDLIQGVDEKAAELKAIEKWDKLKTQEFIALINVKRGLKTALLVVKSEVALKGDGIKEENMRTFKIDVIRVMIQSDYTTVEIEAENKEKAKEEAVFQAKDENDWKHDENSIIYNEPEYFTGEIEEIK